MHDLRNHNIPTVYVTFTLKDTFDLHFVVRHNQRRAEVMELETEDQINIYCNNFFYPTVCHVCKRFGDYVPLKRCSGCKMISYCGKEHQRQHWVQHKPLCKAIQDALRDGLEDTTPDDWSKTKQRMLETVVKKKGFLEGYEMEMFLFPKECAVCHEEDLELLVVCRKCAISFCKDHIDDIAHRDACEPLKLYFHINLSAIKKRNINFDPYLQHGHIYVEYGSNTDTKTSNRFQDMNSFINTCWNAEKIEEDHSEMYNIVVAKLSEFLTRPLTLFHAMQLLNYVLERKELVIHVVAADDEEEVTLKGWEILLHHTETGIVSLVIIMIGTRLKFKSHSLSVCEDCLSQGKKVSFEFHSVFYEDYVCSPSCIKPDLIVGFNVGVGFHIPGKNEYRYVTGMTELSIQMLAEQNCPFLLTCKEQEKLEKYPNNINTILNRTVDYLHSGENPFASLRPYRSLGPKLIFYNNKFIVIYRSLGS